MNMRRKIWNLIRGGSFHGYLRTESGYPLTLSGCMPEYPVSLSVAGNAVQDGTPSPDNPVEVQGCGEPTEDRYKIPVTVSGRNLFPKDAFKNIVLANAKDATVKTVDGRECISVTSGYLNNITSNGVSELKYLFTHGIKENTQYTLTFSIKNISVSTDLWVAIYHTDGTWRHSYKKTIPNDEWGTFIVISDAGKTVSGIGFTYANGGIRLYDHSTAILVEGAYSTDTMPAYEPYHTPQTIPIYMDAPIYGNGTISDTVELDVENRKAMLTRRYGVVSFDGSESWKTQSASTEGEYKHYIKIKNSIYSENKLNNSWSNMLSLSTLASVDKGTYRFILTSAGYLMVYTDGGDLESFKAWLSEQAAAGTPLTVVYQLVAPVTTDISDMQDWDSIPKLWRGTAILTADTTIQPSDITVKYYADKPEEVS